MAEATLLVTVQQMKDQLNIFGTSEFDSSLLLKGEEATDIVIGYLKRPAHGWTERTVPPRIRAAILLVLGNLWAERGDTQNESVGLGANPISKAVMDLLERDRDPAVA